MVLNSQLFKKSIFLILLLPLIVFSTINAQECATQVPQAQVNLENQRLAQGVTFESFRRAPATAYQIPVAIHIVRRTNGTGGFTPSALALAMSDLNMQYIQVGWTFYQYGAIDYIDDDFYFNNTNTFANFDLLKQENVVPEAMNVYFAPNTGYCGVSSFTTSSVQGILMDNACAGISTNNSTYAHEVGHYFDLFHTHETAFAVECPDGSNCSSAGDLLCDTPADPTLSGHVNTTLCTYDNVEPPPASCDATPYNPQVDNLMSYSTKLCRDLFTTDQINKMIFTLENNRPELAVSFGGLSVVPPAVQPLTVPLGFLEDTTVWIYQTVSPASATITSYSTTNGVVSVIGPTGVTLTDIDSASYLISYDATLLTSACDLGEEIDTVVFQTTSAERPEIRVPIIASLSFVSTSEYMKTMNTNCLTFEAQNTAGFGNQQPNAFSLNGSNGLYDGSLLLGVVNGIDTTVYKDVFGANDFIVIDTFVNATTPGLRTTEYVRFATNDGSISGSVTYDYDPSNASDCQYVIATYELKNECSSPINVLSGIFADFDVLNSGTNAAEITADSQIIYVTSNYGTIGELQSSTSICGIMMLSDTAQNLRALSNPTFVYPNNGLVDGEMFVEMNNPNNFSGSAFQDWSALLTNGSNVISSGNSATFTIALLYSNNGLNELSTVATEAQSYYNSLSSCCIGIVGNIDNDPGQGNDISDLTRLIDFLFISLVPLDCDAEADLDGSTSVDIGDLTAYIDFLFLSQTPLLNCF